MIEEMTIFCLLSIYSHDKLLNCSTIIYLLLPIIKIVIITN